MPTMTGGQALVQQLRLEGVDLIFGLPGVQMDWAYDALYDAREYMQVLHTRHEQATAYMADGYARSSGRVGVCMVVPGPGVLNTTAALSTAYACSSPVLCITGQIPSFQIGKGRGLLHEIPNQRTAMASVTKWSGIAMTPAEVPGLVHEAFQRLRSGRPRPVEIEVPLDVFQAKGDVDFLAPAEGPRGSAGDLDILEQAAVALGRAERPLLVVGGGLLSSGAWVELQQLAEMLEAPVIMSQNGRGAISDRHYLAQVPPAAVSLVPASDVVMAIGTRYLQPSLAPWRVKPGQTFIQLDIDPEEIGRNQQPDIGIEADAKAALAELLKRVPRHNRKRSSRKEELDALKADYSTFFANEGHRAPLALAVRAALPDDGILVGEMTQVAYWCNTGAFPIYQPRGYITPGYQGTLGFGFATALGVKVANPNRAVVSINGDGGFMFTVQELSTMAKHNIPLVAVVFNDNAFGNVKRIQQVSFAGRNIAVDLHNPDFLKLADAFGVQGMRAGSPQELTASISQALSDNKPTLIEVPVQPMPPLPYDTNTWTMLR
ncbi:MAG: thiamine pyrophosphate-binding protein [Dehalococcoidia bacterium]|nr:thiamine pyrophosphate-binding protein [Dehalococcoidia bacterium]